jgi:hypothetical protein
MRSLARSPVGIAYDGMNNQETEKEKKSMQVLAMMP